MQPHAATLDLAVWEDGNGVSIHYSSDVTDDLRRLAVDGFNAFAHGGVEIGGVLYGRSGDMGLDVLAYAELECEHALGPRFVLSEKDHAAMAGLLEPRDGLESIGWFRAHTRSGLELDAKDREVFDRYFARPLGVGLILKPTRCGPATAAFYVRRAGGEVGPERIREFAIEPAKRETAEKISTAVAAPPAPLPSPAPKVEFVLSEAVAPPQVALVISEPVARAAALARPKVRGKVSQPRRSWPWAMCAGVLLGAVITLALQSRPAQRANADTPPQPSTTREIPITTAANLARPLAAASAPPNPVASQALQPPTTKDEIKPRQREVRIPLIVPTAPALPVSLPAPPAAGLDLAAAPKSVDVLLNPLLSIAPPPVAAAPPSSVTATPPAPVTPKRASVYAGPRAGRLIWTGDLARRGVIEMEGSHVSPGSLAGVLPGVPLTLRIMPAEFTHDGLTVFTSDPLRDNKTEPPSQANGWNGFRFRLDAARARELVLLETPNAANDYKRLAIRNDGRPCFVVLMEWAVE